MVAWYETKSRGDIFMRISSFAYFFSQAMTSMQRNRWMSIATVVIMALCLLIMGTALLVILNINELITTIESDVEIIAYLDTESSSEEVIDLGKRIKTIPGVAEIEFISKDEALANLQKKFGPDCNLLRALDGQNPLPDAYRIKATQPEQVFTIAKELESWSDFEDVRYGQGLVEKLFSTTRWVKLITGGLMFFWGIAAIFVVAITIRLAVNARQKEVEIMKVVGATDWFIRWPFLIEGVFLGLMGAIIAVGILSGSYLSLVNNLQVTLTFIPLISEPQTLFNVFGGVLIGGIVLGAMGTMLSIWRFLDV